MGINKRDLRDLSFVILLRYGIIVKSHAVQSDRVLLSGIQRDLSLNKLNFTIIKL